MGFHHSIILSFHHFIIPFFNNQDGHSWVDTRDAIASKKAAFWLILTPEQSLITWPLVCVLLWCCAPIESYQTARAGDNSSCPPAPLLSSHQLIATNMAPMAPSVWHNPGQCHYTGSGHRNWCLNICPNISANISNTTHWRDWHQNQNKNCTPMTPDVRC